MGHKVQEQFDRAEWKLGILILSWVIQITLMMGLMGLFSYRLADTVDNWTDEEHTLKVPVVRLVWECTNVGLNLLALILTFVEIGKFAAETLTPFSMLFTQVIKLTCGCGNLALDIVVIVVFPQGHWSIIGVAIGSGLVVAGILPLVYTLIVHHRVSKFEDYSHPANIKHYGFGGNEDTSYHSQSNRLSSAGNLELGVTYQDRPESRRLSTASSALTMSTLKHGFSAARSKRTSAVSTNESDLGDGNGAQAPTPREALGSKRASYNHERDTQFDDFFRRHSVLNMKSQDDRIPGVDFGWAEGGPTTAISGSETPVAPTSAGSRTSVAMGAGVVKNGRPRGGSNRSMSHEVQLIAVPERVEEDEATVLPHNKIHEEEPDKLGLLAHEEDRPMGQREPNPTSSFTDSKTER